MAIKDSASKGNDGQQTTAVGDGLLVSVGKIAGVGGIALCTFLFLFRTFLTQRFMSSLRLEPGQGYRLLLLFMLCTFGTTIVGLTIWASRQKTGRQVSILLLLFALLLVGLGAWLVVSDLRATRPRTSVPSQAGPIEIRDSNFTTNGNQSPIQIGTPPDDKTVKEVDPAKNKPTSTGRNSKTPSVSHLLPDKP